MAQQIPWSSTWNSSTRSASSSRCQWLGFVSDKQLSDWALSPEDSTGGAGAAPSGLWAPETQGSHGGLSPSPFSAVTFILGLWTPLSWPSHKPPDSCLTPRLSGFGLSSRMVIIKSGEVWSVPALGKKVGQGRPCLVLVGRLYLQLLRIWPRPTVDRLHFVFGLCYNKSLFLASKDVLGPFWRRSRRQNLFEGCHLPTCLLKWIVSWLF